MCYINRMRALGRFLQFAALLMLPLAMVVQLFGVLRPAQLLVALVFGVAAFYLGRVIEGYSAGEASRKNGPKKGSPRK